MKGTDDETFSGAAAALAIVAVSAFAVGVVLGAFGMMLIQTLGH